MYTIEEFIDIISGELIVSCALPKILPDIEVRRIIETQALPWFYANYQYAVQKSYYFIDKNVVTLNSYTQYGWFLMPEEVQNIIYLYPIKNLSLFSLGINAPNLSVNLGVTNQPYLSSYVTTIGELGMYKTVLDSFSDMLNQLSKFTLKYNYNENNNRLQILTFFDENIIAEVYVKIQQEALFTDVLFQKWVIGKSKQQLGNLLGRYNFKLPGGIQYNYADIIAEGKEELQAVQDTIKGQSNSGWFFMVKR